MVINVSTEGLVAWLRSKNWSAHTVAVAAVSVAGLITYDPQVQTFIAELFKDRPTLVAQIVLVAGIILKYSHSSSDAGKVASAQAIQASSKAPTPEAVQKATTFPIVPVEPAQPKQ